VKRGVLLTVLGVMVAALLAAPAANAKGGGFFGLDYTFNSLHNRDTGKLAKSGAKTVRWTFFWPRIEHSSGSFNWSTPDRIVGDLAARGIRVLPVMDGSPSWVAKTAVTPPVSSPKARNAWKRFLRAAVKRYGPHGSYWAVKYRAQHPGKRALPISTWQIWNEPNLKSHFHPHPSPSRYARLLKLSNGAIRRQDRSASVMFAGMPGYSNNINAWKFLGRVYEKHGVKKAFDIAALHPYGSSVHQMLEEVERLRRVMDQHGDRRTPMWITEVGWGSSHPTRFGLTKGKHGQARILKSSFRALHGKRHQLGINRVLWFNFRDPKGGTHGCSFCNSAGLLQDNYHPKPSWRAFRSFAH
jgi:polysaccharide biosynthesis protein PslG